MAVNFQLYFSQQRTTVTLRVWTPFSH